MGILDTQSTNAEIVIQQAISTTDYRIVEIIESIQNRFVRVEIELGPFTSEERPDGQTILRGSSRRGLIVWENESYDEVRDTWRNEDLMTVVATKL